MVTPTNHVIARNGFTLHGSFGTFGDFCNIFPLNIGEDQKEFHHQRAGPLTLCHIMVNPAQVIALRS